MKPVVDIKDCYIYDDAWNPKKQALSGIPSNYPDEHNYRPGAVTNGQRIYTTNIVSKKDNIVETERTIYRVANWIEKP